MNLTKTKIDNKWYIVTGKEVVAGPMDTAKNATDLLEANPTLPGIPVFWCDSYARLIAAA